LKPDDKFLTEMLKKFHGQLYYTKKNKKKYYCTALMLYLEKDEHNIYHAFVTSKHCFENEDFSKIKF